MDAWGKFQAPDSFHRLEHHCADVAACFEALLRDPVLHERFMRASVVDEFSVTTAARLTVLTFLHDFGKLNTGFQFKVRNRSEYAGAPGKSGHIVEAFLAPNEILESLGLFEIYRAWGGAVDPLLCAALSHHGRPARPPTRTGAGPPEIWKPFSGYDPSSAAALLGERSRAWFPQAFRKGPDLPHTPALAHLFAGIVTLADQIGSNEEFFEFVSHPDRHYIDQARVLAGRAVEELGFRRAERLENAGPSDVQTLFGYEKPRPSQSAVTEAPLDTPLLILESETGSGKTEAAVLRFAALWRRGLVDGLYFAVPTRAAAKQLHDRIRRGLARLFPEDGQVETVLAVPGYLVVGNVEGRRVGRFEVFWEDEPDEATRLARWSAESARKFLSATAAVGTVDQALLGGLKVKWAHFRAASLARSLLVVDEVHASDTYMTEVLRTLLQGHLEIGGQALLMSATLGATARTKLVTRGRIRVSPPHEAEAFPYPVLTIADGLGTLDSRPIIGNCSTRRVSMNLQSNLEEPSTIAARAVEAARGGAKVLVVRNTVISAQQVFRAFLDQGGGEHALSVAGIPALHHSRFAAEDRELLDDAVELVLGKNRVQGGSVVIGTQTLEQSLDIDADLLISDICPVDVLLQRIGRLHRHQRNDRPQDFRTPICEVLIPEAGLESGLGGRLLRYGLGVSEQGGVYRNLLVVEATRRLIAEYSIWTIPEMNRMLVERATHPELLRELAESLGGHWLSHEQKAFGLIAAEARIGQNHSFTRKEKFDEQFSFYDIDENVRTRLGEDGPRIVLAGPVTGPFGKLVQTFALPAHLFRGSLPSKEEIEATQVEVGNDGLILLVGEHRFVYDRTGIRKRHEERRCPRPRGDRCWRVGLRIGRMELPPPARG